MVVHIAFEQDDRFVKKKKRLETKPATKQTARSL